MIPFLSGFITILRASFCSRYNLSLEIMALRQQLAVLKRKNPRPSLRKKVLDYFLLSMTDPASEDQE
jgi:hypothetical protein